MYEAQIQAATEKFAALLEEQLKRVDGLKAQGDGAQEQSRSEDTVQLRQRFFHTQPFFVALRRPPARIIFF